MIEHIDSIFEHVEPKPTLPCNSFLDDLISKLRRKLKTIEEIASSTKLMKVDSENLSTLTLRQTIQNLISEINFLEVIRGKQIVLINHISNIKDTILVPLQTALIQHENLQQDMNAFDDLNQYYENVESAKAVYLNFRESTMFIQMATLKHEAEYIENILNDMLIPLRDVVNAIKASNTSTSSTHVSAMSLPLSPVVISLLCCPTGELLARLCLK